MHLTQQEVHEAGARLPLCLLAKRGSVASGCSALPPLLVRWLRRKGSGGKEKEEEQQHHLRTPRFSCAPLQDFPQEILGAAGAE